MHRNISPRVIKSSIDMGHKARNLQLVIELKQNQADKE